MKREKIQKAIARNILKGTINATSWAFEALMFMGELTIEAFLNPSYYADLPSPSSGAFSPAPAKKMKKLPDMTIRQSIWKLQKQGFVEKEGKIYKLTAKGRALADYVLQRKKILNKKWDNKYRVVIFDIPEKDRHFRDWLRQELCLLNYKSLQKSVFISKLSLSQDIIKEIKQRKMGNYVNYLLVEKVYKNIV